MAALVQGYPRQTNGATMLQTRPMSASGIISTGQSHPGTPYGNVAPQQRNSIHGMPTGVNGPQAFRGSPGPVQPYAFTNTPSLNPSQQWQQFRNHRTSSTPSVPTIQSLDYLQASNARPRYSASSSMTNLPGTAALNVQLGGSRDDSGLSIPGHRRGSSTSRPHSAQRSESSSNSSLGSAAPVKPSPERYRRAKSQAADFAATSKPSNLRNSQQATQDMPNNVVGSASNSAIDDSQLVRGPSLDEIQRFRRRSMPALDSAGFSKPLTPLGAEQPVESSRLDQSSIRKATDKEHKPAKTSNNLVAERAVNSASSRAGSSDSHSSGRSAGSSARSSSSANRNAHGPSPAANPALTSSPDPTNSSQDYPRLVNIPPRSSSSDAASTKRTINPSPLSKPTAMDDEPGHTVADAVVSTPVKSPQPQLASPAVRQLAAINQSGKARSKTSRLRRAFSFGSAAEFRKNVPESETSANADANAPAKLHKERNAEDVYNEEQERIAQQQEAAGIGSNIYTGGKIFTGSTDNVSISSTASSASIMIRKMGRGMKKSTRSLVGLFRPKSIIGAPAPDSTLPEATEATVSMITVEAERERVNVHADLKSQNGGGTGFPHLERNSMDAAGLVPERLGSSGTDDSTPRKSIVGGEKERAEVLAAVRKGILKHTNGSASPSPRPSESHVGTTNGAVTALTDSPNSSAPSTPNDEAHGHRRTGQVSIGSEDYFMTALRLRQDTKSAPATPQDLKRNATFSPRIAFYETWASQEYDRRGEVATCNRLTPMLAQQIKEELNSFKMEMEVHENSKIYTHFF
ncbi:hypothetical protein QBC37DRAFT_25520 [Rhypophila decipiens]|uniref:Uncharacterized protein n=1 Tax=Rhypophila decipiens TaxID=261697 RepID=A0AAN6YER8_9PEZI|nr:hypothetical protein QBC37DRAFT_25520 [Rhypophila decipiens]